MIRENKRVYLSSPTMHDMEMEYIKEAFDTNWVAPLGKNVDEFENAVCKYLGIRHSTALVSGTAGLHLALKRAGIKQGDIVFCSDLTFSATVNPVSYEGGIQVFIDSEEDTWNMDPRALEKAFLKYPDTKIVIVANLYGTPAKLNEIKTICEKHNAILIEDAAESLGATINGQQTGTFGNYGVISFNGNKIITTSGGGMFLSNSEEDCKKILFWATQAREHAPWYQHEEIGYNYRMSNIVAGIGRGQMDYLDEHVALKRKIYETYKKAFKDLPLTMNPYKENMKPNFWLSCIKIDDDCNVKPMEIYSALQKENIESRPIWKPMHMQPVFRDNNFISLNDSNIGKNIFEKGLCIPSDIKITKEEQDRTIEIIKSCFK
jgi:dTDP-4-amino-4,6-dideoxygalactose transaminase